MSVSLKVDTLEPGDKIARITPGRWGGAPSLSFYEVERVTKTTLVLKNQHGGFVTYNVDRDGNIGGERGMGRRSAWDTTPNWHVADDPAIQTARNQIRAAEIKSEAVRAATTFANSPTKDNADIARKAIDTYVAMLGADEIIAKREAAK